MSMIEWISPKTKRNRPPTDHMHLTITCGSPECQTEFVICGAGGVPCFVWCPVCMAQNHLWEWW